METKTGWKIAGFLAVLHFALAVLYSFQTPFLTAGRVFNQGGGSEGVQTIDIGAPDEIQHVIYAARLANGEGFPVLKVGDPNLDLYYQAHQPPLFYVLTAAWMKLAAPALPGVATKAQAEGQDAVISAIKARSLPGASYESFQQQGRMLRLLNSLIGALTVLALFYFGAFGLRSVWAGLGAAAFGALLPMNVALSGAISNDPLLICLCSWVVALLAGEATQGLCVKRALFIGLLTGLALLTKTTALMLIPLWVVAWFFARREMPLKRLASGFALALLVGGLWWIRNQGIYGEPFVMKTFNEAFKGRSPLAADFIEKVGPSRYWIEAVGIPSANSFVGAFSYWDIWLPEGLYRGLLAVFFLLGASSLLALRKAEKPPTAGIALAWATVLVTVVLFIQFNLGFYQAQGRYLIPGLVGFSGLAGLGLTSLSGTEGKRPAYALLAFGLVMLLVNLYVLMILPGNFEARILPLTGP